METLVHKHVAKITRSVISFQRQFTDEIHWEERLIGITGQRGVGKTTLILQHIKQNFKLSPIALYVSMDDLYFTEHTLVFLAEEFVKNGGKYLFLDEVHRYADWASQIKNIYDDLPDLHVVFTGSSLLQIRNSKGDLSRRAAFYKLKGLSFREYINFTQKTKFPILSLKEILTNHQEHTHQITNDLKPIPLFKEYLKMGYFPFFIEYPKSFLQRVEEVVSISIDIDVMNLKGLNTGGILKLKQLLYIIAQSVPFKPNITTLSERIGVNRNTLIAYINHLEEAGIIRCLYSSVEGLGALQKPEKIYLENTCFNFALGAESPNIGMLRETFFLSQFAHKHKLTYTTKGDFIVDGKYHFEIGGQSKTMKQLKGASTSYLALDEIENGFKHKIPLWMFGFIY